MKQSEVEYWSHLYAPFGFKKIAIEPRSKAYYPLISWRESLRLDGNIAAQYDGQKTLILDMDSAKIASALEPVFENTCIIESPKGYGIVLKGPVPEPYYSALWAWRCSAKGLLGQVIDEDYERAVPIIKRLSSLGIRDDTAIHGLFKSADGKTYYLLPPSITCAYQGRSGAVRGHSSQLPICNHSPTRKHKWFERTFYNFTYDLMSVAEFFELIGVNA